MPISTQSTKFGSLFLSITKIYLHSCPFLSLTHSLFRLKMSSAGVTVAEGGPQLYFCHQCDRTVTINPSPSSDLLCPTCHSGFVEEFENPNSNPNPAYSSDPFTTSDPMALFLESFFGGNSGPQSPGIFSGALGSGSGRRSPFGSEGYDPGSYLLNLLSARRDAGAQIELVFENHPGGAGFQLPANIGDYFLGPGFEQLIQQLAENDPNRYGTPPASKIAVEGLPDVKVDEGMMKSELAQCAVCKDDFDSGVEVKQMPCKHVYHKDCIIPWLEMHNSCPVCRYELPTDDPDYENRGGGDLNGSSGSGSSQGQRRLESPFTISLPWPWGGSGSTSHYGGSDSSRQQDRDTN